MLEFFLWLAIFSRVMFHWLTEESDPWSSCRPSFFTSRLIWTSVLKQTWLGNFVLVLLCSLWGTVIPFFCCKFVIYRVSNLSIIESDCNSSICKFTFYRRKAKWFSKHEKVSIVLWFVSYSTNFLSCGISHLYFNFWSMHGICIDSLSFCNSQIWTDTDNNRTGMLPFVFDDSFG